MIRKSVGFALVASQALGLSPDGKCRILALRGGGVHGVFEVGVLKAFVE
jgi:predicted acylesterase/phospholipase RssA